MSRTNGSALFHLSGDNLACRGQTDRHYFTCPEIIWHVADKRIGTISNPAYTVFISLEQCYYMLS